MGWKEAASLVLMALKKKPYTSLFNYKILMLKRSGKSSFMPNGYVFPGGTVDAVDASNKWLSLFEKCGCPVKSIVPENNLPPMFKNEAGNLLQKEISLRVTAIRETFEETGLLLCRTAKSPSDGLWAEHYTSTDLLSWRLQVQKQPDTFLDLCDSLQCVPDVWALKLWSNWLTPPGENKRFDTVFYTACLPHQPEGVADNTEIQELTWYSPDRLLRLSMQGNLWLPPPQLYELSRIMRFCMLEDAAEFANQREGQGCERYSTARLKTKEGSLFPLPGDDAYGEKDENRFLDYDFAGARSHCMHIHRIETFRDGRCRLAVQNADATFGHILPVVEEIANPSQCCKNK